MKELNYRIRKALQGRPIDRRIQDDVIDVGADCAGLSVATGNAGTCACFA
jgi:hypothetical protein